MSLTFIHTADWHLGHTYWRIGARAAHSAEWRYEAVRRIWDLAVERRADFVLAAGDIFDSDTPSESVRHKALEVLADAPVPVYLISGNHDPCAEGSIWGHPDFLRSVQGIGNVKPVLRPEEVELGAGARLFPCPVTRKYSREDATAWIPNADRGEDFRIGLAHGNWRGYFSSGEDQSLNLIDPGRSQSAGLDYLALGDFHSYTPSEHAAAKVRTYYAGTPEIGAKDNVRGGHVLCVTLPAPGDAPVVEPCFVGRVRLEDWGEIRLRSAADIEALRARTETIPNPDHVILRLRLAGQLAPAAMAELEAWLNAARESLLGVDASRTVSMVPSTDDFQALKLERVEEAVLQALQGPLEVGEVRGAAILSSWSEDEAVRQEAISLYYRLLNGS